MIPKITTMPNPWIPCVLLVTLATGSYAADVKSPAGPAPAATAGFASKAEFSRDMSVYRVAAEGVLKEVRSGGMPKAAEDVRALEKLWDKTTSDFKWGDFETYKPIDIQLDHAIDACEASDAAQAVVQLERFLALLAKVHE
jgi:hypothetical protein